MTSVKGKGRDAVVDALKGEGVTHIFGLPGGQSLSVLYDALYDEQLIKPILVRHEQAASYMAYAYAKLTATPGVCSATVGPGAQNLVTGLAEAWGGCVPVIAISPQVASWFEGMGGLQEFPQVPLFAPFTKWSYRIARSDRIQWAMRRAFQLAASGKPGPVFLEIPPDIGEEEIEIPPYTPSRRPIRLGGDPSLISEALNLIMAAERPIIVAGGGVYLSGAFDELREFAELMAIPVLTSASGKGALPEDHPLSAGLVGIYRTRVAKKIWDETDLILSFGCRFEELETLTWSTYPTGAKWIQVDVDPSEFGRNWLADLMIGGDAKVVLQQLITAISQKVPKKAFQDLPRIQELTHLRKEYDAEIEHIVSSTSEESPIRPLKILRELRAIFPQNTILCHEHGSLDFWAYSEFPLFEAGACVSPSNQTCMGMAVAGAIGARFAKPNNEVVAVSGDGAVQMMLQELPTAVQYRTPFTLCILNNYHLGWIKYIQQRFFDQHYVATDYEAQPDFAGIAEACGCLGLKVERSSEVNEVIQSALRANRDGTPTILDFEVKPMDLAEGFIEYHDTM